MSDYGTPYEVAYRKRHKLMSEIKETELMKWGKRFEAQIALGFAEDNGFEVRPLKSYIRIPELRMGTSCDFEVVSGEYKDWLMEVKNVDSFIFREKWAMDTLESTPYIETQVQHQMEVTDRPGCLIVAMVGGNTAKCIVRERDREFGRNLKNRVVKFWRDNDAGILPDPIYSDDADFIIGLHQNSQENLLDAKENVDIIQETQSYCAARSRKSDAETDLAAKKALLLDLIGDRYNKVAMPGYKISCGMTKSSKKKPHRVFIVNELEK